MLEDSPKLVELPQCVVKAVQGQLGENTHPRNIAEVKIGIETPDDIVRDKTLYCGRPHLSIKSELAYGNSNRNKYLHEHLRIVTCPLLEVSSLLETPESRERGS